jgi:hypothetical protein
MRLTKRGRAVLIYLPAALALTALILWVSARVWYVPGEGYCIGTMLECFSKEFTR